MVASAGNQSFFGSCIGTCCATLFFFVVTAGTVETQRGVKCLLLWVQAAFIGLTMVFLTTDSSWVGMLCEQLSRFAKPDIGICECEGALPVNSTYNSTETCRQGELVLRSGASAEVIFLFMFALGVSGCGTTVARSAPVLKFFMLPVIVLIFLFVPNHLFSMVNEYNSMIAALFALAQTIVLIDAMLTMNDSFVKTGGSAALEVLGIFSLVFLVATGILVYFLFVTYVETMQRAVVFGTLGVSSVLLVLSITECIKGALIVSAAVVLFSQWLAWQALAISTGMGEAPFAAKAILAGLALLALALGSDDEEEKKPSVAPEARELANMADKSGEKDSEKQQVIIIQQQVGEVKEAEISSCAFAGQCLFQAFAVAYIMYLLVPQTGSFSSLAHLAVIALSLLAYGWTLVAPKLLKNRDFS